MRSIKEILRQSRTIAVVGLSANPERYSHQVAHYLQEQGYRVIPVNPTAPEILGEKSYPDLLAIPEKVDAVDIFRRPEDVPQIVEQAIQIGAPCIWMQQGIVHDEAAAMAQSHGLDVVMDRCMMLEHQKIVRKGKKA